MLNNIGPLFGISIIYKNGNLEYNSSNNYKETHNKLIYDKCQKEINKTDYYNKMLLENNRTVGLWSNAAIMTKFYDCIVVIESFEYKVALCFIPETVTSEQINSFRKMYTRSSYNNFHYGDRTLIDNNFRIKSIKDEPIEYILNIMEGKQETKRRLA